MCQEMIFYIILATAMSGMPLPEIRSLGERSCPRSTTAIHSVAVDWTLKPPIEKRTSHRRPNEMFAANA